MFVVFADLLDEAVEAEVEDRNPRVCAGYARATVTDFADVIRTRLNRLEFIGMAASGRRGVPAQQQRGLGLRTSRSRDPRALDRLPDVSGCWAGVSAVFEVIRAPMVFRVRI